MAIPDGSSSEAPVIKPGPNDFRILIIESERNLLNDDESEFRLFFFFPRNSRAIYYIRTYI